MSRSRALVAAAIVWSASVAAVFAIGGVADRQGRLATVWDGVYTEAQADRGRAAYTQSCASCHADDLRGKGTAPSLVEESFAFLWGDMSLGDLFTRTRALMPSDRPDSLSSQTYADITAFILQRNGFPAGPAELDDDVEALGRILITARRP